MVFVSCYLYFVTGLLCIQESVYAYVGDTYEPHFYGDAQRRNDNYNTNTNTNMNSNTIMRRYQPGRRRNNYNSNQNTNVNEAIHRRLRDPGNRIYDTLYNNLQNGARSLQRALSQSRRSNIYRRNVFTNGDNHALKRRRKADDDTTSADDNIDLDELMNGPLRELFTCQGEHDEELDENAAEAESNEQSSRRFNRNKSGSNRKANSLARRNRRNYQLGYPLSRRQLADEEDADDDIPSKAEENNAIEQNSRKSPKKRGRRKYRRSRTRTKNVNTNQNFNSNVVAWRESERNR